MGIRWTYVKHFFDAILYKCVNTYFQSLKNVISFQEGNFIKLGFFLQSSFLLLAPPKVCKLVCKLVADLRRKKFASRPNSLIVSLLKRDTFFPNRHVTKLDFNGFLLQNGIVLWWKFSDSSQKKLNANWASNFGINAKFSPNCMFLVHSTKFCQIKAVRKRVIYWTNAFMKVGKLLNQIICDKALKSLLGFWTTYDKICQFDSGEKHVLPKVYVTIQYFVF